MTSIRKYIGWVIGIALFVWAIFGTLSLLSKLAFLVAALNWSIENVTISIKPILLEIGKRISEAVTGYRELMHGIARLLHLPHLPSFVYDVLGVITFSVGRGAQLGKTAGARRSDSLQAEKNVARKRLEALYQFRPKKGQDSLRWSVSNRLDQEADKIAASAVDPRFPLSRLAQKLDVRIRKVIGPAYRSLDELMSWTRASINSTKSVSWLVGSVRLKFYFWSSSLVRLLAYILVYGGLVAIVIAALFGIDYLYRHFA